MLKCCCGVLKRSCFATPADPMRAGNQSPTPYFIKIQRTKNLVVEIDMSCYSRQLQATHEGMEISCNRWKEMDSNCKFPWLHSEKKCGKAGRKVEKCRSWERGSGRNLFDGVLPCSLEASL